MRWQRHAFPRLAAAVFLLLILAYASAPAFVPPALEDLLAVVPGAKDSRHEIRPLDFYKMVDAGGRVVGAAFITSRVPPAVGGYRDEIDVLVGIDTQGKIVGVRILGHSETPEVMRRILDSDFLRRFIGRKAGGNFGDIEAVTGATISSRAIIEDVRTASASVALQILGSGALGPAGLSTTEAKPWARGAAVLVLVAAAVAAVLLPRRRWLRGAVLAASVAIVGFWLNGPVTIGELVDLRTLALPGSMPAATIILLLFALLAPLLRGNLYCAYLCPFGALQDGAAKLKLPKCRPNTQADHAASWLRWIVALATICAIALMGSEAARTMEPFALCFSRQPVMPVLVQTGVVLAAALFVRRLWCRSLCPTGLVLDLLALAGSRVRHALKSSLRRRS